MNWKLEATNKLCRYDAMQQAMVNIPEEIRRLEAEACTLGGKPVDAAFVGQRCCSPEDLQLNNLVKRKELKAALEQAAAWLRIVEQALSVLNPEERLVLQRLYVYPTPGGIDRLCGELNVEKSSIYRKRDKALQKFTYALYGFCES